MNPFLQGKNAQKIHMFSMQFFSHSQQHEGVEVLQRLGLPSGEAHKVFVEDFQFLWEICSQSFSICDHHVNHKITTRKKTPTQCALTSSTTALTIFTANLQLIAIDLPYGTSKAWIGSESSQYTPLTRVCPEMPCRHLNWISQKIKRFCGLDNREFAQLQLPCQQSNQSL